MNKLVICLALPCLLGFIYVQAQYGQGFGGKGFGPQYYGGPGAYGGGGGYYGQPGAIGDQYNQALAYRYLQTQKTGLFGLTTGELISTLFTLYALYYLTNGTGRIATG